MCNEKSDTISLLRFAGLFFLNRLKPFEAEHYYHLRIARQIARSGNRPRIDNRSWIHETIFGNNYPPLLHYLLATTFCLYRMFKNSDDIDSSAIYLIVFIALGMISGEVLLSGWTTVILIMILLFTSPLYLSRCVCGGLRGENIVVALLPFLIFVIKTQCQLNLWCSLIVLLFAMSMASRTSAFIFATLVIWSVILILHKDYNGVVFGIITFSMWSLAFVYYRVKGKSFIPFFEAFWYTRNKKVLGTLMFHYQHKIVITSEERSPQIEEVLLYATSVCVALILLIFYTKEIGFLQFLFVSSVIQSVFARRYLIYSVIMSVFMIANTIDLFSSLAWGLIITQIVLCCWIKVKRVDDLIDILKNFNNQYGDCSTLIVAPWNIGHFITHYTNAQVVWDSNFPSAQQFEKHEKTMQTIIKKEKLDLLESYQQVVFLTYNFSQLAFPFCQNKLIERGFYTMFRQSYSKV